MRIQTFLAAAAVATTAMPALADGPRVYPVPTTENYCPAGLQPVSVDGTISCGQPNASVTWYDMKRHAVQRARYTPAMTCAEGQKGCS